MLLSNTKEGGKIKRFIWRRYLIKICTHSLHHDISQNHNCCKDNKIHQKYRSLESLEKLIVCIIKRDLHKLHNKGIWI